jgi:hypothetical protein
MATGVEGARAEEGRQHGEEALLAAAPSAVRSMNRSAAPMKDAANAMGPRASGLAAQPAAALACWHAEPPHDAGDEGVRLLPSIA